MRSALAGPTPGSIWSCSAVAVLRLSLPRRVLPLRLGSSSLAAGVLLCKGSTCGGAAGTGGATPGAADALAELSQVAVAVATSAHRDMTARPRRRVLKMVVWFMVSSFLVLV